MRIQYTTEKPTVDVEVEVDDAPDDPTPDGFLKQVPADPVPPLRKAIDDWTALGGKVEFSAKMMFLAIDLDGANCRMVRCRKNQINIIRRHAVESWGGDGDLHEQYLARLEAAPVFAGYGRDTKMWIKFERLSAGDLSVLLRAACELAKGIQARQ